MSDRIFKAYDIRGIVPDELDERSAFAIGHAFCRFLAEDTKKAPQTILVSRDMRSSSEALHAAFCSGISAAGGIAIDAGLCTTPMLYFGVCHFANCEGGAAVTASHNGPRYNGFKLCRAGAVPISRDTGLLDIERLSVQAPAFTPLKRQPSPTQGMAGAAAPVPPPTGCNAALWNAYWIFISRFKRRWPEKVTLAVDPANGMGCLYLPLLMAMGAKVVCINDTLDGSFPAHEANPIKAENIEPCQKLVTASRAGLGVAFDGDADRVAFVDEQGNAIPCDLITAILGQALLKRTPGASVLHDLRSSRAVAEIIREAGGVPVRERVGHSFMKAAMRSHDCIFGGELSGHYYFKENAYADSAFMTLIELLNVLGDTGQYLSTLVNKARRYHQSGEINFEVADKNAMLGKLEHHFRGGAVDHLDGLTVQFPEWWFNVRPSNTEPLLRLNVEANTAALLGAKLNELQALIR